VDLFLIRGDPDATIAGSEAHEAQALKVGMRSLPKPASDYIDLQWELLFQGLVCTFSIKIDGEDVNGNFFQ